MDNLELYIARQTDYISCIYDEYVYLEMLCLNTIFYDEEKIQEVKSLSHNTYNDILVNFYYKNKLQYITCYFNNISNFQSERDITIYKFLDDKSSDNILDR